MAGLELYPKFNFLTIQQYDKQEEHRLRANQLRENEIYVAVGKFFGPYSDEGASTPAIIELIRNMPGTRRRPIGYIALTITMLSGEDYLPTAYTRSGEITEDGSWSVTAPFDVLSGAKPMREGFFLPMPDDEEELEDQS